MKRYGFTLLAIIILLLAAGTAQADKGTKIFDIWGNYVSASGDAYENGDGDAETLIGVGGGLMQLVHEYVGVGLAAQYDRLGQGDASLSTFMVGPRAAAFFNPDWSARTTHPFVGGAWYYSKTTLDDGTDEVSYTTSTIAISGGLLNMFTESVGVHLRLTYNMDTLTPDEGDSVDGKRLVFGAGINVVLN